MFKVTPNLPQETMNPQTAGYAFAHYELPSAAALNDRYHCA